jgi:hypothetical protein
MVTHTTSLGRAFYRVLNLKQIKTQLYELTAAINHLEQTFTAEYNNKQIKYQIKNKDKPKDTSIPDLKGHVDRY